MSALRRPAVLACSAAHKPMAGPFGLGLGLPAALMFLPQRPQVWKPFASQLSAFSSSFSSYPTLSSSNNSNNRDRSHNGSASSRFPRLRFLAASVPLVMVANEAPATSAQATAGNRNDHGLPLNAEVAAEVSKGSVLVSTFSKTLVLLVGVAIAAQSLAARAGIDLVKYLHLKERLEKTRVLSFLASNTIFKLAFGTTFALSAFMSF
ncbi:hypothetical protein SEPCBS119000_000611 [Sporothrix epigloea]|uniref:Uncharacterized protein n=1 Tax=Sporothrix epigloea TaxID=1892477 RepID=A0ABP0D648_9PEZI